MYRIEEYSLLLHTFVALKTKYKTYKEAIEKMNKFKSKFPNKKYRIIKEEIINNYEIKITVITE
jgi:hypothetical protein